MSSHACRTLAWSVCALALWAAPAAAQPAEYVIGPQDVLSITVFEHADLSAAYSVEADGTISFPLIGRTRIGGLTVQSAERTLERLLAEGYLRKPQVSIAVQQYRSQQIFVMGEVRSPGGYPFTGDITLLEALARAGGVTERAGSTVILVRAGDRGGQEPTPALPEVNPHAPGGTRIDLDDMQRGGASAARELRPGDTLFVPRAETIFVTGQVTRPGEYAIRGATTLLQALSLAGGVTERGSTRRIRVVRTVDGREAEQDIRLQELVEPGDTIIVRERLF